LSLSDTSTGLQYGGIGWFELKSREFHRLYHPELAGHDPEWIGASSDSVFALFTETGSVPRKTKLLQFSIDNPVLSSVDLGDLGAPGENVQSAALWGDTLLLSTETNVVIKRPGQRPELWSTRMYASRSAIPLYLATFSSETGLPEDTVRFQILPTGKPVAVKAWLGDWMEIASIQEVEAYVDDADWRAHQRRWAGLDWQCGDSLCFARVRVPRHDSFQLGDFTQVPFSYVGKDANGIRIRFQAAWARHADLLPVLMPR